MGGFTKGPWEVLDGHYVKGDQRGYTVCVFGVSSTLSDEAKWANAHLIAAAPDMYEALVTFTEYEKAMESGNDVAGMVHYASLQSLTKTALAKARGE